MSIPADFKQDVYTQCAALIGDKLQRLQQALRELAESAAGETKSSAGDKFETGRAMLHIEQDNIRRQISECQAQQAVLQSIDPAKIAVLAGPGSLIRASGKYYFLSTALGRIMVNAQTVFALSPQSPLGALLAGRHCGDRVVMNGAEMVIEAIG